MEEAQAAAAAGKQLFQEMLADAPPPISKLPNTEGMEERINKLADSMDGKAPAGAIDALKPCVLMTIQFGLAIQPWLVFVGRWAARVWALVPANVVMMIFGAALCFFGGAYTASIAAVEAFRTMGGERARDELQRMAAQIDKVLAANAQDDAKDDDGDGVADVDQISSAELVQRKMVMVLVTIDEPQRIQTALAAAWAAGLAVLATLNLPFAATTAIGLGIADMVKMRAMGVLTPPVLRLLGPTLKHWCTFFIEASITLVAIAMAWYFSMFVAAVYASMRGGRLFAQGFFGLIVEQARKGVVICPGLVDEGFDPDASVLDEIVGYVVAAQGLMFQLTHEYAVPFPFNLLLLPLTLIEWFIRSQMSGDASSPFAALLATSPPPPPCREFG